MSVQTGASDGATEAATVDGHIQGDSTEAPDPKRGILADLAKERDRRQSAEKAVAEYAAKFNAIENANLGELERAQKDAAEARTSLADLIKQTTRQKVALTKELPAGAVDFLRGDTEEEFTASADNLLALIAQLNAPKALKPDPSQGPKAQAIALNGDPLLEALKGKLGIS